MNKIKFIFLIFALSSTPLWALGIVTTTTTVKAIGEMVAGANIKSIASGNVDPHYLEPKPSYMLLLRDADAVLSVGLDLEVGWLPSLIRGARNPKLKILALGDWTQAIEVPEKLDRAQGDVHPLGNPHFYLDPQKVAELLPQLAIKLGDLDASRKAEYLKNAEETKKKLLNQVKLWQERINKTAIKNVITYHKTLNYFLERFNLRWVDSLEPKPGIPPTTKHILELVEKVQTEKVGCILSESHFEGTGARSLSERAKIPFQIVATEVGALPGVQTYNNLIENLVQALEKCAKEKK